MPASNGQELERRTHELRALIEVAETLTSPLDPPALFKAVMRQLTNMLEPAELGAIMLWDEPSGCFRAGAALGYDLEILRELRLLPGESITGKVYDKGIASLLATPTEVAASVADMRPANRAVMMRAWGSEGLPHGALAAPLRVGDRKLGVLVLETLHGINGFSESDLPLVQTIADLIALALDRARWESEADAIRGAREADRHRSELIATLSHELRTPLIAVKGYSTALLLEEVNWPADKRQEFLRLIDQECDNLQVMINDILDSALIDVGHLVIERQPVRLQHLVREVGDEMQSLTQTHRIVMDISSALPIVDVDPYRIKQVVRNILDNAIKYSPDGGLIVIRGEMNERDVVVSISDQGVGISPEDLIPLFTRYFRVKQPRGRRVPGIGLGLPLARAIIEAHGGQIWAESKVGQGTTMHFSLPRGASDTEAEER